MSADLQDRDLAHGVMSFGDHLEELRRRVILCLVVPLPAAILLFIVAPHIRDILIAPALAAMELGTGVRVRLSGTGSGIQVRVSE